MKDLVWLVEAYKGPVGLPGESIETKQGDWKPGSTVTTHVLGCWSLDSASITKCTMYSLFFFLYLGLGFLTNAIGLTLVNG